MPPTILAFLLLVNKSIYYCQKTEGLLMALEISKAPMAKTQFKGV